MPNLLLRRNTTAGSVPTAGVLSIGELAFNSADVLLYTKDNSGTIWKVAGKTTVFTGDTQTLTAKTLTSPAIGSNLVLNQSTANYTVTWSNPAAARTYNIPDNGSPAGTNQFMIGDINSPSTGQGLVYNGTKWVNGAPTSPDYAVVQDEGTALTARTTLNFVGPGVTASDDSTNARTLVNVFTATSTQEGTVSTNAQTFSGIKTLASGQLGLTPTTAAGGTNSVWLENSASAVGLRANVAGTTGWLPLLLFNGTATANVSNLATEGSLVPSGIGSLSIPANFLYAGRVVRLAFGGYYSTSATAVSVVIRLRSGSVTGTVLASATLGTWAANLSQNAWSGWIELSGYTTGSSGSCFATGYFAGNTSLSFSNGASTSASNTAVTINTTVSNSLVLTVQFGVANVSNTMTLTTLSFTAIS